MTGAAAERAAGAAQAGTGDVMIRKVLCCDQCGRPFLGRGTWKRDVNALRRDAQRVGWTCTTIAGQALDTCRECRMQAAREYEIGKQEQ